MYGPYKVFSDYSARVYQMYPGISKGLRSGPHNEKGHAQYELRIGIVEDEPAYLFCLMQTVDDTVSMKKECLCRLFYAAVVCYVFPDGRQKLALILIVVFQEEQDRRMNVSGKILRL